MSNEQWEKGLEIPLMDMAGDAALSMKSTKLTDMLSKPSEKVLYVYDFMRMWIFYVELMEVKKDAPSTTEGALAVEFKKYTKNNLTEGDLADTYVVNLKAGESFFVGYMPNGASNTVNFIELKIFGEYREQLFTKTFPAGQGGKSDTIKAESDAVYYVEISRQNGYESEKPLEYTIDFKKTS
jgi:hypothetical protein